MEEKLMMNSADNANNLALPVWLQIMLVALVACLVIFCKKDNAFQNANQDIY
jgi:hypothetical protein